MMDSGETRAVVKLSAIAKRSERDLLSRILTETGKEIIEIDPKQMKAFAGNMLQVHNAEGVRYLVMSERAEKSLNAGQKKRILAHCQIITCPLEVIEIYGGGSARCMMAEIFLPPRLKVA
jgi:hypothetical protein